MSATRQTRELADQLHAERTRDAYAWCVFHCQEHDLQPCQWCLRMAPKEARAT